LLLDRFLLRLAHFPTFGKPWVNALVDGQVIKTFPLKGVDQPVMSFEAYLTLIRAEAVSQWRQYVAKARRYVRLVD
jgi:hypothetical protein